MYSESGIPSSVQIIWLSSLDNDATVFTGNIPKVGLGVLTTFCHSIILFQVLCPVPWVWLVAALYFVQKLSFTNNYWVGNGPNLHQSRTIGTRRSVCIRRWLSYLLLLLEPAELEFAMLYLGQWQESCSSYPQLHWLPSHRQEPTLPLHRGQTNFPSIELVSPIQSITESKK